MNNAAAAHVSIAHGFRGPMLNFSTACSSSAASIGEAYRLIRNGDAHVMVAGGSEALITPGNLAAWDAMRALAHADAVDPARSCKPFSADRTGLVLGEGAAALVLESAEHAQRRGARVYAELAGYGNASDAANISRPDAGGQVRAMHRALADAKLDTADVGYLNAHGTATQVGDVVETDAIKQTFGCHARTLCVSSTKALHGHLIGGAGALEMVVAIMALGRNVVPPTAHLDRPDPACDLDYVPNEARSKRLDAVMSNSFGFGGMNSVLARPAVLMRDLRELAAWFDARPNAHDPLVPSSLPDPSFVCDGRTLVSFSTNNYLALATSPRLKAAAREALDRYGVGNCESRLLGGNLDLYDRLEARLARLKRKEAAMLFATGYLTNLGVLPMLTRSTHLARAFGYAPSTSWKHAFFTDEFNHLSLREGIRASGAPSIAYKHLDMDDLERKLASSSANIRIIVTDGVFSQHGDIVPLPDMMALAERHDAVVYIDDAHGTGVLGPTGAGTTEHFGIDSPRIITMGTLSKAYGCIGGFVATESYLRTILHVGCSAYRFHVDAAARSGGGGARGDRHGRGRAGAPPKPVEQSAALRLEHARRGLRLAGDDDADRSAACGRRARVHARRAGVARGRLSRRPGALSRRRLRPGAASLHHECASHGRRHRPARRRALRVGAAGDADVSVRDVKDR